jgi:uncharacterized protein (DUF2141 family)
MVVQFRPHRRDCGRRAEKGAPGPRTGGGIIVVVLLLAAAVPAVPAAAAELRVTTRTIRSNNGEILIGLYDNAAGFERAIANAARGLTPDPGRLVGTTIRARRGAHSAVFAELPPGRYVVIVVHDENDNGRLDKNAIGMPTEGYGFSNDAHGFLGTSPSFDAAAITLGNADKEISIALIYPGPPSAENGGNNYGSGSSGPPPGR